MKQFTCGYAASSLALALAVRARKQPVSAGKGFARPAILVAVYGTVWFTPCGSEPMQLGAA